MVRTPVCAGRPETAGERGCISRGSAPPARGPGLVNRKGVAMVVVLLIIIALSLLASGVVFITTSEIFVTRNDAYAKEAMYAAEAGIRFAERILRKVTSRDMLTDMYLLGYNTTSYQGFSYYNPNGAPAGIIGWKLLVPNSGLPGSWSWASSQLAGHELDTYHHYEVYVANNSPLEVDGTGKPMEADGIFFIRSVGYANGIRSGTGPGQVAGAGIPASRKILEESIFLKIPLMDTSQDSFGGGPGNQNQQRIQ